ncbi:MAG: hypothetical protein QM817_26710 [Archangium sp.]
MNFRSLAALLAVIATSGCRIEKPATVVPPPPSVVVFKASDSAVTAGGKVTLTWETSNATAIELREATTGELSVPATSLNGTLEATITANSLFVLVARGAGGSDARAVSVSLSGEQVGEVTFQALPPIIAGGASSTLVWSAPGASAVTLSAGGQNLDIAGQRSNGAVTVSPRFDTTYSLVADGVTRTVNVTVQAALLSADVSPRAAEVGATVNVSWTAAGADRVVVNSPGRGQLFEATTRAQVETGSFADTVPPTPDFGVVTYEVTAEKGTERFTRTFEVNVGTGLAITRFDAPLVAASGTSYSVRWETRSADEVDLVVDGVTVHRATISQAAVGGFAFVAPAADFTVELVATNTRGGRVTKTVQVDSAVGVPTAATLTANPTTVAIGQPVTLTFAAAEARRGRIVDSSGVQVFSITGQGAEGGSATVYPSENTTYTFSADNQLGSTPVTATAPVTVTGTAPTLTQFPPTAISGQVVTLSGAGTLLSGFPHSQVLNSTQADFHDISSTGTRVLEQGANVVSVDLPFTTFTFGRRRTGSLVISRAGWMAWGAPAVVNSTNGTAFPSATGPGGMIAPFWDDLTLLADSAVYTELIGDAPEQSLVVQWDKLQVGTTANTRVTFQVRVHQRGMVSFHYQTMTLPPGYTSYLAGLQDGLRLTGLKSTVAPASDTAVYFFSPVVPPVDLRVFKGQRWGGFVKVGDMQALVSQQAGAVVIPTDLSLTELMFRPHAAVPNGQYLEVVNRTGSPLDMSGWQLRSPNVPTFSVAPGFMLQPDVPLVLGASSDPAENDDAGVAVAWGPSGFFLSPDSGTFTIGTADAGAGFTYTGPSDGGRGTAIDVDPGPFVSSASTGIAACAATTTYGSQTPLQLGSPGSARGCGFGYELRQIPVHYVDISDGGTPLVNSPTTAVDGKTVPITLAATAGDPAPFAFTVRRPIVSMSLDGWMSWGSTTTTDYTNSTVPSTSDSPVGKLAIFWDDMHSTPNVMPLSEMYWKHFAAGEDPGTPGEHWVFQWAHVRHYATDPADDLNYEIKLFPTGVIEYHYGLMQSGTSSNYGDGNSAAIWLENTAGSQALFIGIEQPVIRSNTAYRFIPR